MCICAWHSVSCTHTLIPLTPHNLHLFRYGPSLGPLYKQKQASAWEAELRAELRAARPRLLERIEADDEESTDEGTPAMAPDGSPSPRTARREGERVPTGAKRLKGE